ncbi:MAG: tRNA uridine-5-carboxymethylaminomethyl(34) synthesis GTPase MnmE [Pseudomonadota bacterium]
MPSSSSQQQCICALATPPGRGALAIVRVSGKHALLLAEKITKCSLLARQAKFTSFYSSENLIIDQGLAIYFRAPASFTGEDVVEFHCHGNPLLADALLKTLCSYGARLASPGEFSLRAFLNNKIDLTQAEAIADLINASTEQGIRSATSSLQGAFSKRVTDVLAQLVQVRMHIEAHLDFPDEEIDRKQDQQIDLSLQGLANTLKELLLQAKLGERLQTGATIAIAGKPNAGKSSLLNVLALSDVAIVTEIPGTTRDPLTVDIEIKGIPVCLIDTAGLRNTQDIIEVEGIARAQQALQSADLILWLSDIANETTENIPQELDGNKIIHVQNKIDLQKEDIHYKSNKLYISAKTQQGIDSLLEHISKRLSGNDAVQEHGDTPFLARSRHIVSLQQALDKIYSSQTHISDTHKLELAAEDLRLAQQMLSEITGEFTADDLLGKIFSEFCIGK